MRHEKQVLKPKIVTRRVNFAGLLRVNAEWEVVEIQL
jgi:hypothetical protein